MVIQKLYFLILSIFNTISQDIFLLEEKSLLTSLKNIKFFIQIPG